MFYNQQINFFKLIIVLHKFIILIMTLFCRFLSPLPNFLPSCQQVNLEGLTGRVHFDDGRRSDVKLDLLKLHQEKVRKVGFWTPSTGINITKHSVFYGQQSSNVTLIVVTRVVSIYYEANNAQ